MKKQSYQSIPVAEISDEANKFSQIEYKLMGIRDPKAVAICKSGDTFYLGYYQGTTGDYSIHKF